MIDKELIENIAEIFSLEMFNRIERMESVEDAAKIFNQLLQSKAKFFPITYCQKEKLIGNTKDLKGEECIICPFFILNGGICSPL